MLGILLIGSIWLVGCSTGSVNTSLSSSFAISTNSNSASPNVQLNEIFDLKYVPREKWAELKIIKNKVNSIGGFPTKITVHHTAEERDMNASSADHMRVLDRYHQKDRGWACIGYHFVISQQGTIYEGRQIKYQGAHVSGNNSSNVGIALMGNFEQAKPTKAQVDSLKRLVNRLQRQFKIPKQNLYGHRDFGRTLCPGESLYTIIKQIRNSYQ